MPDTASPADRLAAVLQDALPEEFLELGEDQLAVLERLVAAAVDHRAAAFDTAIADSLNHLPRLLRPAVRKALGL